MNLTIIVINRTYIIRKIVMTLTTIVNFIPVSIIMINFLAKTNSKKFVFWGLLKQ